VDLSSLFSNPALLILLAVVALAMFGGGSFNVTELILSLLRSLKLIPQPQGKASEQLYRGYTRKAWETLRSGDVEGTKNLLLAGMQATEAEMNKETAIQPTGIGDQIKEWLKSPIFLIAIAVGAFLIFGGGSCKKTEPKPQGEETLDVTPASWSASIRPAVWRMGDTDQAPIDDRLQDESPFPDRAAITPVGWCTDGPVRAVVTAPVRAPVRLIREVRPLRLIREVRPVRRAGAALTRVRPLRWLFGRR